MTTRVAVVDYGWGNLQSVAQAVRAAAPAGTEVLRTSSPDDVRALLAGFDDATVQFVAGRFARLHPRLLANVTFFSATKGRRGPSRVA